MPKDNIRAFDNIDIQIISTIDEEFNKQNYSPSTKQISEILEKKGIFTQKIPPRTIRYRISKLEEKGILQKKIPITHERKLGIGESFFLVEENPKYRAQFYSIINENAAIDWYIPTYGKYNGYYVHSIYSLDSSNYPHRIFQLLQEKKIIRKYFTLNLVDYKAYSWNFDYFDENGNWSWNWEIWKEHLQNEIKSGKELEIKFDIEPERIDFDVIDIQILRNMYLHENLTPKKLKGILDLSESQIGRRIKAMEQKGIIRGYRTGFYPFTNFTPLLILIETEQNIQQVFYHLLKIPYPQTIALERPGKIGVAIEFPSYEIRDFLDAFYLLKPLLNTYFLQFWPYNPDVNMAEGFDFFDEKTNNFIKLDKEYKKTLKSLH